MPEYICTMGPSIYNFNKLLELYNLGLRAIRFNMSHIDYDMDEVLRMIDEIKKISGEQIETMLDTCSSEARIQIAESKEVFIGDIMVLGIDFTIDVPYQSVLSINDILQIDDGKIQFQIIGVEPFVLKSLTHGKLKNGAGVYSPKLSINLPFLSEKGKEDINLAFSKNLDWIACSFVKTKEDVDEIRRMKQKYPECRTKIMAKIETVEAVQNLEEIISVSDGIMIARGDLAVAFPIHEIAALQDYIANKAKAALIPLVIGTGFLRSMKKNSIPERSEVTDLYHAFKLSHKIMFSGETAIADNPAHILTTANDIFKTVDSFKIYELIKCSRN